MIGKVALRRILYQIIIYTTGNRNLWSQWIQFSLNLPTKQAPHSYYIIFTDGFFFVSKTMKVINTDFCNGDTRLSPFVLINVIPLCFAHYFIGANKRGGRKERGRTIARTSPSLHQSQCLSWGPHFPCAWYTGLSSEPFNPNISMHHSL